MKDLSFIENKFQLIGKFKKTVYYKTKTLPFGGESINLFEVTTKTRPNKYYIAKQYTFGLSRECLNIYKKLKKSQFTENFIDYSIVNAIEDTYHFGIFNKIEYTYEYIPFFFDIDQTFLRLDDALKFIHSKNIIHFDIKPNNIMCSRKNIKLIDFEFSIDLESKKNRNGNSLIQFTHPKRLFNKFFLDYTIDNWAAIFSIYEIFYGEDLFTIDENSLKYICEPDELIKKIKQESVVLRKKNFIEKLLLNY
jgi:serine/threonine protein kinase